MSNAQPKVLDLLMDGQFDSPEVMEFEKQLEQEVGFLKAERLPELALDLITAESLGLDWDQLWSVKERFGLVDSWGGSEYRAATINALNDRTIVPTSSGRFMFTKREE